MLLFSLILFCGYQNDAAPVQKHNLFGNGSLLMETTSVRQMGVVEVQFTQKKNDQSATQSVQTTRHSEISYVQSTHWDTVDVEVLRRISDAEQFP